MTEDDFDQCPHCGRTGQFGLRCHPKFSVKAGIKLPDGGLDYVAYYAHDLGSMLVLWEALRNDPFADVGDVEQWSAQNKKWVEIEPHSLYAEMVRSRSDA